MDTTDNDDSSDDSLCDVLSSMCSHSAACAVDFDENHTYIEPPPSWDFMSNDESWNALWYTTSQLKKQRICYSTADREEPFLAGSKALFRGKSLALECNDYNESRPNTCGQEFWWPVLWKGKRAYLYNDHIPNGDLTQIKWEETFLRRGNATSYTRKETILHIAKTWNTYWHIGDVPSKVEVLELTSLDTTPTHDESKCERARKTRIKTGPIYNKLRDRINAMAAHRLKYPTANIKYWLTDTGCGYDLVSRKHVAKTADRIKKSFNAVTFMTANGKTDAEEDILLHVAELDEDIEPYVMASTPAVLSIGRRCMDFGYEFRWPAGKLPYFITPKGVKVTLVVEDYVPYLRTQLAKRTVSAVTKLLAEHTVVDAQNPNRNKSISQHPVANPSRVQARKGPARPDPGEAGDDEGADEEPVAAGEVTPEALPADAPPLALSQSAGGGAPPVAPHRGAAVDVEDDQADLIDLEDEPELVMPAEVSKQEQLKLEATSVKHLRDHLPKNPYCHSCVVGKMIRRAHGKKREIGARPEVFGVQITADHLIAETEKSQSFLGDKDAVIVYDRATRWKECYPVPTKSGDDVYTSLNHFAGPDVDIKCIWSDGSKELKYGIKHLGWNHKLTTPGISQTNCVAERQVRDVQAGTRALLVQAGLPACFWCFAAPHYCFGTNTKATEEHPSAYSLRFPAEGEWPHEFIPFGARVNFMRTSTLTKDDKPPKFAPTACEGVLLGYRLQCGGRWRNEYQVAELPEFANIDFAYNAKPKEMTKIRIQTVQEVRLPAGGLIEFPLAAAYKKRNNTIEGIKAALVPDLGEPSGAVEPLIHRVPDDDDAEFAEEVVGTTNLIAEHRARNNRGAAEQPSVDSTPPTEVATPPGEASNVEPLVSNSAPDAPGGVRDQPLDSDRKDDDLHGSDTDSEYDIDKRGHKHRKDEYGQRIRKSGRPPYIPSEWWRKMGYPKRLRAKLEYEEAKEAAQVQFGRGSGSAGSGDPYPTRKPAMTCEKAAPMGLYGLVLVSCKGVEETINRGEETDAPPSDEENIDFSDDDINDDFGIDTWEPVSHSTGVGEGCPAMPVTIRPAQEHREQIPLVRAPFNVAVARSVSKKEMYSNPLALKAVREEWDRLRSKKCWSEDPGSVREWNTLRQKLAIQRPRSTLAGYVVFV